MTKLRKLAQGQSCTLRLPGVCCGRNETVVLAHIRRSGHGSTRKKPHDLFGVHSCYTCHAAIDGRVGFRVHGFDKYQLRAYILDALIETQQRLLDDGVLRVE